MHPFPYAAVPLSAGGAPVPGVPMVPNPLHPWGVAPSVTQYPAPPVGWPASMYTYVLPQPPLPGPEPTYPRSAAPAAAGMGVPAVSVTPLQPVSAPAAPGGPHPLLKPPHLPVPNLPVPEGFPNPFAVKQIAVTPQAEPAPLPPGSTAVTGPMGYHPGLGYFGSPPPFWMHLAWQLIQSPEVRKMVGDSLEALLKDELRHKTLSLAVGLLLEQELQEAFRSLTGGLLERSRFLELFGQRLQTALAASGMLSGGEPEGAAPAHADLWPRGTRSSQST